MGSREDVEEIIAEPDEGPGYIEFALLQVHLFVSSYGWYILAAGLGLYYLWKNKLNTSSDTQGPPTDPASIAAFQTKEEARLKAVERLQQKYAKESAEKAEKTKKLEEQKRLARLEELKRLDEKGGRLLGSKATESLRPGYNPLMGNDSNDRVCFRRPGGSSGG